MELTPLVITPEDAKEHLAEYVKSLRTDRNAEDEAIAAGYRAAARGLPVIELSKVIHAGGYFEEGTLPRLAIARSDAHQVWVSCEYANQGSDLVYRDRRDASSRGALVGRHTVRVNVPEPRTGKSFWRTASTVVPIIPPRFRPKRLGLGHILWEVESWTPEPPKDPALLRYIRGDLWAVLATWDLTELERAVLSQRV